jgi:hypothetical protein
MTTLAPTAPPVADRISRIGTGAAHDSDGFASFLHSGVGLSL